MSRLFLCVALLGVAACAPPSDDEPPATPSALDGAWHVRVLPVAHGCPDVGTLSPVRSGYLRVEEHGTRLELTQPGSDPVVLSGVGGRTWGTSASEAWDGCRVDVDRWWTVTDAGATAMAATFTATWDARGACDLPVDHCTVTYAVHGVR